MLSKLPLSLHFSATTRAVPAWLAGLLCLALLGVPQRAEAGRIHNIFMPDDVRIVEMLPGDFQDAIVNNDDDNNDFFDFLNPSDPFNVIWFEKEFHSLDPLDLWFQVEPSGGTTEYLIIESVWNATGVNWHDYHIELGGWLNGGFVSLEAQGALGLGLDFDTPDLTPEAWSFLLESPENPIPVTLFESVQHEAGAIWFEDGILPPVEQVFPGDELWAAFFVYSIDVPDIGDFGPYDFVIRQHPSVPEPSLGALFLTALMALGLRSGLDSTRKNREQGQMR